MLARNLSLSFIRTAHSSASRTHARSSPAHATFAQRLPNAADIGAARMYPVMEFVNDDLKEAEYGDAGVEQQ